jgi:hypothetical protein
VVFARRFQKAFALRNAFFSWEIFMFGTVRWLKVGYLLALATVIALLAQPRTSQAQRAPIAPMLGQIQQQMQPSLQQAQMIVMMPGNPMGAMMMGGGMMGGGMMGMGGGMMGMGGGMMGMGGGMMGMGGGMMGMGGMSMMGMGGGMSMMGMGGMGGMGGMMMGGMGGGMGGMMGFAGKGMGGFNGKKAL